MIFELYKNMLIKEIKMRKKEYNGAISSIFIGGGTPNLISPKYIDEIINELYISYNIIDDAEISIELNPGLIDKNKLIIYKKCGINRVSVGLQAWQDVILKRLGRLHTIEDFINNYKVVSYYFDNVNIDLMYALPGQTLDDWKETLSNIVKLKPKHISCYGLMLEEGTIFYRLYKEKKLKLPDDEFELELFHYTIKFLEEHGYDHYEISNYAQPGYECYHNLLYWKDLHYIGFGAGAYSYIGNRRFGNVKSPRRYIDRIKNDNLACDDIDVLNRNDEVSEYMFLGLRLMNGINDKDFRKRFGISMFSIYNDVIQKNIDLKLLDKSNETIYLTQKGVDLSNNVFEDFLL